MVDVSIIIVSWNTRDILCNCLESVYKQTRKVDFEVIVIDNASTDGSAEMIKNKFPQVILIENSENRGFAAANNQGIVLAKGRYILLLNSDTLVLNQTIAETVSFADAHPETAVIGCRILNQDKTLQPTCFMFPSILNMLLSTSYLYKLFPKNKFFGRERMTWWSRSDVREVDVVTGCFMLVRREAIKQVGMMDERFFIYGEETDWCYRFKQAGWKVMFAPVGKIIHLGGQSTRQVRGDMLVQQRISILQFIRKHHSCLKYRLACFLVTISLIMRMPVWIFIALFSRRRRKESIAKVKAYMACIKISFSCSSSF